VAANDYFLQIDGIEGESTDAKHKGWIDVESWSWGEAQAGTLHTGGGGGAGKVAFQDFHFVTKVSKASPKLFLACASGQHLKEARFVARRAGKEQQEYLTWTFSDLLVSSYQTGGTEQSTMPPLDSISLHVTKAKIEYRPLKADGSLDAPISAGWDSSTNKKA
jgi:type VI secretion system secreted protein Hcp